MRILYVEDHADTVDVLSRLLSREGHSVTGAASLTEARRLCAERTFDLLICDIGLPDGDGWELAAFAQRCGARAIALSGYGQLADVAHSNMVGFVAHLVKPVTFEQLLAAIAAVRDAPDERRSA